jgi:hypothetical protein
MSEASIIPGRGLLYHYTTEEGLLGIIEHDNIRATHIRNLNDYTEFREAFQEEFVEKLLNSFRDGLTHNIDSTACKVIEAVLSKRNVPAILENFESSGSINETFVCSFAAGANALPQSGSDPGDRLSQWRGYSNSTQGFSLGFDRELLEKQIQLDNPRDKNSLLECIYTDEEKVALFQEMGCKAAVRFMDLRLSDAPVLSKFRTNMPNPDKEYVKACSYFLQSLSETAAEFFTTAAKIKHNGFSEECEWRIVSHRNVQSTEVVKIRRGQFGLTPFVEIPLSLAKHDISSLRRIVVGPSAHKEDNKHSVELLLQEHGIQVMRPDTNDGVIVGTSLIPYRSK